MQLKRKISLLAMAALALPLIDLLLSFYGVELRFRAVVALLGIGIIVFTGLRVFKRIFSDLKVVQRAIDQTATVQSPNQIEVLSSDELGALGEAVTVLRDRIAVMNQLLIKSSRVESLNILGSIVVHDMKNISFRLRCLTQNLDANQGNPDFYQSIGLTLSQTTQQMDQMVKRFRDQGETVIVKLRISLNEVVRSALNNVRREAEGLRITEDYYDLPPVWADALLIENAIYNILANACDAMPNGGHLAVRTCLIADDASGSPLALVEIADSGTGMPDDFVQNELFAPFVTTKQRGLGLGLYTCQHIVRLHGGRIRVYSELGRGTVFSVYLPVTE